MTLLAAPETQKIEFQQPLRPEDKDFALEILRKFVASMVTVVENIDSDDERFALSSKIEAGERAYSARFALPLPTLSLDEPEQDWVREIYHRYFRNAVLGKAMLTSTVVAKLLRMASGFVLTSFYAEAYRQARLLPAVELECLTDAFAITEFHHGSHSPALAGYSQTMEQTYAYIVGAQALSQG